MEFQGFLVLIEAHRILGRYRLSWESIFESGSELGQPFLPGAFIKGGQNRGRWLIHRVRREQPQAQVDFRLTYKVEGAQTQAVGVDISGQARIEVGRMFRPAAKHFFMKGVHPEPALARPPFPSHGGDLRQFGAGRPNETLVNRRISRIVRNAIEHFELSRCESWPGGFGRVAAFPFEPVIHPAIGSQTQIGGIFVRSRGLHQHELIACSIQVINAADLFDHRPVTGHGKNAIGVAVAEHQRPRCT